MLVFYKKKYLREPETMLCGYGENIGTFRWKGESEKETGNYTFQFLMSFILIF